MKTKNKIPETAQDFDACRRFVRKVRHCYECLHFHECLNTGRPVALAAREFAEMGRMIERVNERVYEFILPPIKVWNIKATASCRSIPCKTHRYCVAIAYNDRSYDYLKFNEKPGLDELNKVVEITICGHFGKDITNNGK